jgi:two-component system sensor histidine kinase MprB
MIVRRARIRLTLLFIAMFAIVLGVFSIVFYAAFVFVLQPDYDFDPIITNVQAAQATYNAAIERIGLSLLLADAVAVAVVGVVAWALARRTLEPIRDAHVRQQRFVADASHETKNPLTAIKTTTSSALAGDRSAADLRVALEIVDEAVDRLIRLTGDLLVLARSNDPLAPAVRDRSDLSVIASEALEGVGRPDGAPTIESALEPDLPVEVDPTEIERVVRNLLDNAIRYGGVGPAISLRTWQSDGAACLEVADRGPGIAPADLPKIFDPFYRSGAQARNRDGTGLGLAIARDLARRNGGDLTVASRPGEGAAFRLTLPGLR